MVHDGDNPWAFMDPWWALLRHLSFHALPVKHAPHVDRRCDGLYVLLTKLWPDEPPDEDKVVAIREAMELVSLVPYVDEEEWLHKVVARENYWGVFSADRGAFLPPRFIIGFNDGVFDDSVVKQAEKSVQRIVTNLFGSLSLDQRSSAYRDTRLRLLSMIRDPVCRHECEALAVGVVVRAGFANCCLLTTLQRGLDVACRQRDDGGVHQGTHFVIKAVDFDLSYTTESEADALVTSISSRVVPLQRLELAFCERNVTSLVLGALWDATKTRNVHSGVDFVLGFAFCDEEAFISQFSAVAGSSLIESLDVNSSEEELGSESDVPRVQGLQWMAFAVLSRFSRSAVRNLVLQDVFSVQDVTIINEIISSDNPLKLLLGSTEPACRVVVLNDDVVLKNVGGSSSVNVNAGTTVWAVHDQPPSSVIDVLIPGYGVHSVERAKVTPESPTANPSHVSYLDVRITLGEDKFDGLFKLLTVVGERLERLSITQEEAEEETEEDSVSISITVILEACPHLQFLKAKGCTIAGFSQLSELYENHSCQVSVLELSKLQLETYDQVIAFFETLGRDTSRMAQLLRELRLELSEEMISPAMVLALKTMLTSNHTLEVLIIGVPEGQEDVFEDVIEALPPVYVPAVRKPFPLRSKLALVSVVRASTTRSLARLDSEILSRVFAFAALPQKRFVHVTTAEG
ncbi:hypothetical protein Poli38472_011204 [Pythium oligandrum]|uniref:Uncharacterized protein n=1 Tax=Pythium oligandrum TaxID=41045 RepID=A0A8K1CQ59_PYTOL|nr:hypothetical protein Poli38472_011204 [Pythium oligandrum]|eukprot:TMW67584.1 hypothetical protein Poli38472_011204 [Pythium oligandrum]